MQTKEEVDISDYDALLVEFNQNLGQHAKVKTPSHSPTQTPPSLKSDEDSDEVESDLGKGQDINMDIEEGQEIEMDSIHTTSSRRA